MCLNNPKTLFLRNSVNLLISKRLRNINFWRKVLVCQLSSSYLKIQAYILTSMVSTDEAFRGILAIPLNDAKMIIMCGIHSSEEYLDLC